jgi:DNA-binding transcriptional LysR family regulator
VDLNEIMHFTKVVETGSFTRAANALGVPKSTVSRKVAALEERLGARLLHRTTRKLRLTEIGEAFHNRCARVLNDLEDAEMAVSSMHGTPHGTLRVTAPMDFGEQMLGNVLQDFERTYPDVRVELYLNDRIVDLVEEGFDLAIRAGNLADSGLIGRKLGQAAMILVASPDYLEKAGSPTTPEELENHRCILFSGAGMDKTWTLNGEKGSVTVPVTGPLVTNHFNLIHFAALKGMGIAFLPIFHAVEDFRAGRLVWVLPTFSSAYAKVHVVYPSNRHLVAKVRAFLDLLIAHFNPEPWTVAPEEIAQWKKPA